MEAPFKAIALFWWSPCVEFNIFNLFDGIDVFNEEEEDVFFNTFKELIFSAFSIRKAIIVKSATLRSECIDFRLTFNPLVELFGLDKPGKVDADVSVIKIDRFLRLVFNCCFILSCRSIASIETLRECRLRPVVVF